MVLHRLFHWLNLPGQKPSLLNSVLVAETEGREFSLATEQFMPACGDDTDAYGTCIQKVRKLF